MNRIYKVIWSKVKHQYVVVSELAHRDGKRSSAATTSRATWRALAVALMLTSSLAAVPYMGYALDGGTATQSQYIAVAMKPGDGAGHYESHFKLGEGWVKEWVPNNSRKFGNYTYHLQTVTVNGEPKQYWVREGYDITVTQNQARYPSINQGTDYIIDAQKNEDYTEQSDQGLLQAYQTTTSAGDITTLTGVNIEDLNTGVYGGASNTAGVETPSNWGYHIQVGGTGSDSEGYLKVSDDLDGTSSGHLAGATGNTNFDTYFSHNVTLQNGVYVYTDREGKTVNVPTNKVYSIDGKLGVFTDANGNLYTGDVYGDNNEILLSGVGEGNQIYTYWGTKLTDPTQTIGNMTVEHYNKDRIELQQQSAAYHGDDIKDITVNQNENGGSFSFNRLGKYNKNTGKYEDADPAGVITIKNTATSGKSGNDVAIEFSNGTDSFTVQAGSKVEGTTGEASGNTLIGLSINGVDYKLGGGKSVTSGAINANGTITLKQGENDNTGITLTGKIHDYALDAQTADAANGEVTLTGKDRYSNDNAFEVKIDGLVTEDTLGDQIVNSNNLKVAADADGDDNKGNWTITDTSKPEGQQVFTNTTLVNGAATAVEDSAVTSGDGEDAKTYGQSYAIKDTEGNTVTISDVASASALKDVDVLVTQNTSSIQTLQGQTVNGGSITDDGTIELKHDTTTLASISGLHDYALDAQTADAANGEVTLTGKDRYGNDNAFEVKIDGLVTEDTLGDQIVNSNNLKVAAGDKGRWTITDTSKPEGEQVFANTTLADAVKKEGSKDSGYIYTVSDTAGNTAVIDDVASAQKLTEVAAEVGKHTSMTVDGGKAAGTAEYNGGNLLLKDNGKDGQHQYDVKLNDDIYLGGNQTADNRNIALEGSTGSIHAATTEGDNTFDFNSNGGKFETTIVDDNRYDTVFGKFGSITTTTNTSEFGKGGATFTKIETNRDYAFSIGRTPTTTKTSTNIDGSKITSDGVGQTVVDGGSVTVQGVGSILGINNTTTVEGSKITSVGILGGTTEINGAYINAGGIEVNGEPLRDTITGLSNTEWKNDEAWQKTHIRDDRAATEGQLQDVADSLSGDVSKLNDFAVKYDEVNGKPNYDKVTLEGKDGTKITNLAKGEVTATSTDAVNGSQLFEVQELAGKHTTMTVNNGMAAPENGSYTTDGNLQLKQKVGDKGQIEYDVKLNDNLVLGNGDSQITLNGAPTDENAPAISVGEVFTVGQDGSVHAAVAGDSTSDSMSFTNGGLTISNMSGDVSSATVIKGADIQAGGIHLDGTDKIIDGLSNTTWTGMTTTPDKAATEGQLQMVSDTVASGWTATDDKGHKINVNPNTHPTLNFASGKNITVSAENDEINVALNDNVYLGEDNAIALEGSTGHISATVKDSLGMSSNTLTFDDKGLTVSKDAMGVGSGSTNIIGDMITTTDENGNETTIDGGKVTTEALEVNGNSDNTMTFDAAEGLNVNTGDAQLNVSEDGLSLNVDNGAGSNNSVKITQDGTTFSYSENGVTGATTTVIQGQKITAGDVLINGEDGKNTITGLTNTTWKNDAAWQADNIVADRAATEGQLQQAAAASKTTLSNGKNTTVTSKTAEDGHVDYQVNLNDHIVLGDQDGKNNNISINGNEASIILNGFENGEYKNSIEIDAASGMITGLTNAIGDGKDGWETFTDKDTVHGSRAVTEDDLYEVYRHGVQYSVNDDGTPDYTTIVLGNPYNANTKGGGTRITNVAYAETDRKSTEYDGSAAVNVDVLNDAVDNATATVTGNEKHIATNVGPKAEMPHADYSVGEDGKVTLTEVDGNGKPTGNSVVISDVASATDVGNVDKLVDAGLGVDENGNSNVVDAILDVDNKVGDLNYNDVKGDSIQNGDDTTTAIGKLDNRIDGLETDISGAAEEAKKHNTVEAGSNIVVTTSQNANGGTEYNVSVDPNLKVDTVTASGNIDAGSFSTGDITINKDNSGTINGLSNTTWNKEVADAIAANANGEAGTAATQGQLQQAMNGAVQYDTNKDGSVNKDNITLGGSTYDPETHKGGTTITNVADGKNASDAVNMSQLWQTNQAVINNSNNIQSLSNQVGKLDNRIDEVGAGAAALAALHPLDFDPDDKWDFSAGYGNYRGESAVAVGAFYRPNEDTMFSVGGTVGNGDNMVNAGVSFKIGQGNSVSTSRVAMAKEIKSMRDIVAKQDAQIQKLTAMVNALVGIQSEPDTTTMFPDVPENHWAYEAVEAMAKSGLVKGYPDGEFKGDRTMTRYEFAQIVYNAIQAGAEVDARLVEEFKPELEYFHIATVAKDKDGNPTIERVRAN